jgi:hypothetical protein
MRAQQVINEDLLVVPGIRILYLDLLLEALRNHLEDLVLLPQQLWPSDSPRLTTTFNEARNIPMPTFTEVKLPE